jgi:uncharacterized membrane protein HdeD (DUF308 family)
MLKGRRVGTLTAGIVLVVFGILFLIRIVFPGFELKTIVSLWPLILVFLGIEMIAAYMVNKEERIKYDGGAILLVILLSFFAMGMAGVEFVFKHLAEFKTVLG